MFLSFLGIVLLFFLYFFSLGLRHACRFHVALAVTVFAVFVIEFGKRVTMSLVVSLAVTVDVDGCVYGLPE